MQTRREAAAKNCYLWWPANFQNPAVHLPGKLYIITVPVYTASTNYEISCMRNRI